MNRRVGLSSVSRSRLTSAAAAKDLVGVYEDALKSDPQIRQADANRLASREARPQAWAALLPQITGTLPRSQDKQDGTQAQRALRSGHPAPRADRGPFERDLDYARPGASICARTCFPGRTGWPQAGRQPGGQAEATYQAAQQNLILRVSQAYFNVLSALDSLEANQASLEAISRQLDQANKRFEVGLIAITDVQEAKAARDTAAAAVIAAKRTLATAGDQLSEITGQKYDALNKPGDDMPLNTPQPANEDKWVTCSLDQNVSLLSSRLAADIARENVKIAFGGHLPTLDRHREQVPHDNQIADDSPAGQSFQRWTAAINDRPDTRCRSPCRSFSGGLTQSKVRQSQYLWIAAKEQVVQTSRATERQARDAYLGVISGIARVQALRQALESSQTALKATEAGYEVGTRTAVDVLNSRRTLVQAQTDYAVSRYDYIVSVIQLRLAAGNLSASDVAEDQQVAGGVGADRARAADRAAGRTAGHEQPQSQPQQTSPQQAPQPPTPTPPRADRRGSPSSSQQRLDQPQQLAQRAAVAIHADRPSAPIRSRSSGSDSSFATRSPTSASCTISAAPRAMSSFAISPLLCGARQNRHAQRRRLEEIMATDRHQAAADECDIGRRIKFQQLAQRIHQQHLARPAAAPPSRPALRTPHESRSRPAAARRPRHRTGRMTRHQHQQCPGMSSPARSGAPRGPVLLLATRACCPRPTWAAMGRTTRASCRPRSPISSGTLEIEFDVAGHVSAIGIGPSELKRSASPSPWAATTTPRDRASRNSEPKRR